MKRMLIAALAVVVLILAVPSFAAQDERSLQEASSPGAGIVGGAPGSATILESAPLAVPANDMVVSGDVVLSEPDALVIHTPAGMQRFVLTPETQMLAGAAEGDTVTVVYKREAGIARATVVRTTPQAPPSNVQPAKMTNSTATAETHPMQMAMNNPKPATTEQMTMDDTKPVTQVAQAQEPTESAGSMQAQATAKKPAQHLPKTASTLPLIGLTGLLSLAGAATLRAARA